MNMEAQTAQITPGPCLIDYDLQIFASSGTARALPPSAAAMAHYSGILAGITALASVRRLR